MRWLQVVRPSDMSGLAFSGSATFCPVSGQWMALNYFQKTHVATTSNVQKPCNWIWLIHGCLPQPGRRRSGPPPRDLQAERQQVSDYRGFIGPGE